MKTLKMVLVALLLAVVSTGTVFANGRGGHGGGGHGGGHRGGWIAPVLIGAGAAYLLTRPGMVYGAPAYYPAPMYTPPSCQYVRQQAYDQFGRPLFDQYRQPVTHTAYVCPPAMQY